MTKRNRLHRTNSVSPHALAIYRELRLDERRELPCWGPAILGLKIETSGAFVSC